MVETAFFSKQDDVAAQFVVPSDTGFSRWMMRFLNMSRFGLEFITETCNSFLKSSLFSE